MSRNCGVEFAESEGDGGKRRGDGDRNGSDGRLGEEAEGGSAGNALDRRKVGIRRWVILPLSGVWGRCVCNILVSLL